MLQLPSTCCVTTIIFGTESGCSMGNELPVATVFRFHLTVTAGVCVRLQSSPANRSSCSEWKRCKMGKELQGSPDTCFF